MPKLRVALGQMNPRLGDIAQNSAEILRMATEAATAGADIIAFPEMALVGYPLEDLVLRQDVLEASHAGLQKLAEDLAAAGCARIPVIVGFPQGPLPPRPGHSEHAIAHNAAGILLDGRIVGIYAKQHLPNYGVFDEYRIFRSGESLTFMRLKGCDVAVAICEDIWHDHGPAVRLAEEKPGLLIVINGSPFERDKDDVRVPLVARRAQEIGAPVAYVNLVGGQDDLVFDGDSFISNAGGLLVARAPQFEGHLLIADLEIASALPRAGTHPVDVTIIDIPDGPSPSRTAPAIDIPAAAEPPRDALKSVWNALVLGLRDYADKNGFPGVVLGLSGGIDSAVCAAIAVDALGPDRVLGVSLPSKYSSQHSRDDAADSASRLGIAFRVEPIAAGVEVIEDQLHLSGLAGENLQARIRGVILMAISNAEGHLVLTTGNKSEIAVGYSTIYGDSVGGFAPLKDVPKTLVWDLARWRNQHALEHGSVAPIPENSITKPPSAELRPDQVDQDSLPDYEVLDRLLELYIGQRSSRSDLLAAGFESETVDHVISLVDRAEWKRRQSAVGPKISELAFGRDRRLPITYRPLTPPA